MASSSRPGQGDEPWLDVSFRADVDLTPIMAWIILIAAVVGAAVVGAVVVAAGWVTWT